MIKRNKVLLIASLFSALVVVGVGTLFIVINKDSRENSSDVTVNTQDNINLNPPTEEERSAGDDTKQRLVDQTNSSQREQSAIKDVTPIIVNADFTQVSAYVPGIFEEGGNCIATFTQNSVTITRTSSGFQNASYTQCTSIKPELPNSNKWTLTLRYESTSSRGTSKTVELPL